MTMNLGAIRKRAGLTQQEMADRLDVPKRTYGSWEREEVAFSAAQLLACADVLGCSCDEILGRRVPSSFLDPMEAALHATWSRLDQNGRGFVLSSAEMALAALEGREGGVGAAGAAPSPVVPPGMSAA